MTHPVCVRIEILSHPVYFDFSANEYLTSRFGGESLKAAVKSPNFLVEAHKEIFEQRKYFDSDSPCMCMSVNNETPCIVTCW